MQVYYLGNPKKKRRALMSMDGAVYLDNDEVAAVYLESNRLCFVIGRAAFCNFSVWEFLSYSKSLELRRPLSCEEAGECLKRVGLSININKRLDSFDVITQKIIKLAALLKPSTTKIVLNFDGTKYTKKRRQKMQKLFAALSAYELAISVSDIRFAPSGAQLVWCLDSHEQFRRPKILKQNKQKARVTV